MNPLQEELTTIRMCGALREVPLSALEDPFLLARIVRAAVKREKAKRELNHAAIKEKFR